MTKPAFTPGPYEACVDMDGRHHAISIMATAPEFNKDDETEPYHPLIASVHHGLGHAPRETAEATARLIAAAPDMYEALSIALIALDLDPENHPPQWSPEEAGEKIRAALAKVQP